jgi:hypothetical protein
MLSFSRTVFHIFLLLAVLPGITSYAQNRDTARPQQQAQVLPPTLMPPHPPGKMAERYYNIDAKRAGSNIFSDDALPRSREFKRIDSTYYVGWLYEGVYKYEHAADYLGFKNAAVPLERALALIERDYAPALRTRTDNVLTLYPIRILQPDYTMIAYYLMQCYANTDQPDKVFNLLRRTLKWRLQFSYYMDTYNYMAWTVHRNRFYTSSKYPFLKNSIAENEALANRYLDSSLMMIQRNKAINEPLTQYFPGWEDREKMSVYHYKNILHSYSFNIDSANYYFDLMRQAGRLPHNNYANFKMVCGDFKTAEEEYRIASTQDAGDKRLQEWAYYSTILDIYKAKPKTGALLARNMIKGNGTTPGYGWYNIALSRTMLYDGQISESKRYADKAAEFKELHIGTTLGQSHYDFSIQLLKLINKERDWQMEKFEHANWWYNPSVLLDMSGKLSEKYLQQFLIINQFAQNPERERVIYKLFSTESTVTWDEIWYLVHDFSTRYFINVFRKEGQTDNRKYIRKYYDLFTARLIMQQGKYREGKRMLDKLLTDPTIDGEYEKLFLARVYQAEAECAKELKNEGEKNDWLYRMYTIYPQLVPFIEMPMNMRLHLSGDVDKDVAERLKGYNINWVTNSSIAAPDVYAIFEKRNGKRNITFYVIDKAGNYIVQKQGFSWQKPEEAAKTLAYRIFNVGGKGEGLDSDSNAQ